MPKYPVSLFKTVGGAMTERRAFDADEEKRLVADGWNDMSGKVEKPTPPKPEPTKTAPKPEEKK